jgi:hypothetical protein
LQPKETTVALSPLSTQTPAGKACRAERAADVQSQHAYALVHSAAVHPVGEQYPGDVGAVGDLRQ